MTTENSKPHQTDPVQLAVRARQKEAVAAILSALWGDDPDLWFDLPKQLILKLDEDEAAALSWCLLKCLPVDRAGWVVEAVFAGTSLDGPLPDMESGRYEARDWAKHASVGELKSFIRAAVDRLPRSDKERLKRWLK